jgi:hypothetical protein
MIQISKFAKANITVAIIVTVIAVIYPLFIEKVYYSNKSVEAVSVAKIVENVQKLSYINSNKYIAIKKADVLDFVDKFSLNKTDIQFYDYSIFVTYNSYTLYAEPKIQYLKNREINPKRYIYHKVLNKQATIKWQ